MPQTLTPTLSLTLISTFTKLGQTLKGGNLYLFFQHIYFNFFVHMSSYGEEKIQCMFSSLEGKHVIYLLHIGKIGKITHWLDTDGRITVGHWSL